MSTLALDWRFRVGGGEGGEREETHLSSAALADHLSPRSLSQARTFRRARRSASSWCVRSPHSVAPADARARETDPSAKKKPWGRTTTRCFFGRLGGERRVNVECFFCHTTHARLVNSPHLTSQESVKTKHPQLLYESKLYKILQGGSECPPFPPGSLFLKTP